MQVSDSLLKSFLIDAGLLSRGQIEDVLRQAQDKPLSRALIDGGVLSEEEVRRAAAHALGVPFVVLDAGDIDDAALEMLPEPVCREHNLVAYRSLGGTLEVALLNIEDAQALEPLASQLPQRLVPRLTTRESLRRALVRYQKLLKEKFGERLLGETDSARALLALVRHAAHQRASEVHIETTPRGVLVRYRHGKQLRDAMLLPAATAIIKAVRSAANVGSKTLPQEGRFKLDLGSGVEVAVRVSSTPLVGGEKLVLRILPGGTSRKGYTLEGLGLHGQAERAVSEALDVRQGLVLVCGTQGSGRTTLLYTLLDLLNEPEASIASVEERVTLRLPYVAQTQAPQEGLTMAAAVRGVLRQDPDILMIDRITDRETFSLAAAAAARGVFVLASVEARDVAAALAMLRASGADEQELSQVRLGVGTALVRKLCDKQTRDTRLAERRHLAPLEEHANFAEVLAALKDEGRVDKDTAWKDVGWAHITGCSECDGGYRGKVGVFEASSAGHPGLNLIEDALFKAAAGQTGIAEVLRFAQQYNPEP